MNGRGMKNRLILQPQVLARLEQELVSGMIVSGIGNRRRIELIPLTIIPLTTPSRRRTEMKGRGMNGMGMENKSRYRAMHLIPLAFSGDTDFTEFHGLNQR